jgi:hypothetical protein
MKLIGAVDERVLARAQMFETYYIRQKQQRGGLIGEYFSQYGVNTGDGQQYGDGFGDFLKGLWRIFRPAVISGAKAVGKTALSTAGEFIGDVASGANWREAGRDRINQAGKVLEQKLEAKMAGMAGSGRGRRNKTLHNAVKLFSFTPPSTARGSSSISTRRRQTRKRKRTTARSRSVSRATAPKRRRRRKRAASASAAGGPRRRRRPRRRTTAVRRRTTRRRRTQRGSGGGSGGVPAIAWL